MHILIATLSVAALWVWVVAHQLIIKWVWDSLVERLPPPDATSGKVYAYVYSVLQFFSANTKRTQDAVTVVRAPKTS